MTVENIAEVTVILIVLTVVVLSRWRARRIPEWGDLPDVALERESDGAAIVPVSMLAHRRTLGYTTNGISPRLWVTGTGLRFKVFRLAERPFADFKRVEAYPSLVHGTRLVFVGHGRWLDALIPDRRAARAVLRMLPGSLPLSPAAATLRGDRSSNAPTPS